MAVCGKQQVEVGAEPGDVSSQGVNIAHVQYDCPLLGAHPAGAHLASRAERATPGTFQPHQMLLSWKSSPV